MSNVVPYTSSLPPGAPTKIWIGRVFHHHFLLTFIMQPTSPTDVCTLYILLSTILLSPLSSSSVVVSSWWLGHQQVFGAWEG